MKNENELLNLLLDCIDHAYLQTDGTYGDLSYEVSDQVRYVKNELQKTKKTMSEYVDLGLPSRTLWKQYNEDGYYTYDEAVKLYGDKLPTEEQFNELMQYCKISLTNKYCTLKGRNGNVLKLPAQGYVLYSKLWDKYAGNYWTSNRCGDYAMALTFCKEDDFCNTEDFSRLYAMSVRLVMNENHK